MADRLINGVLVIVIGVVLLMNTTGNLPWSVWDVFLRYWPLLIIGLGVQIAFSKRRMPGIALALILALLLSVLFPFQDSFIWPKGLLFQKGDSFNTLTDFKQIKVPLDSVKASKVRIQLVAPSLETSVKGAQEIDDEGLDIALSGELHWDRHEPTFKSFSLKGGELIEAIIESPVKDGRNAGKQKWDLKINSSMSTDMDITAGAVDLQMDLVSQSAGNLSLSAGVANARINFGPNGRHSVATIAGGVVNVELMVPESAGIRVSLSAPPLIARIRTEGLDLVKQGNLWISEDYEAATTKIEVSISCGAGRILVKKAS